MNWTRHGEFGMVSDPYRVGKYYLDGCTLYGLWFNHELIGYFNDFEDCQIAAEKHKAEANK